MPLDFPEIRKFLGLFAQRNTFDVPDGAMEEANNVVIADDDTITKSRGFYRYYDAVSDTINALFLYQSKLMAVFSDRLAYFTDTGSAPNETGTRNNLSGATIQLTAPRISRAVEQSGNLYLTTDLGVMKIDAYNGTVYEAGAPPGLDLRGQFLPENGVISGDTEVGYRVLFGRRDGNSNTLLGAPSDILVITNTKVTSVSYTSSGAGPYTVTVTSTGHNLATGMSITVSNASDTDADGTHTVTVTSSSQFTFTTSANPAAGTLDYSTTRTPLIQFSIPQDITSTTPKWFYQVYRSSESGDDLVAPDADFRLVEEQYLSSAQITARTVFYTDEIDQVLVEFAPELYTNPNSREGELQANARPPLCEDMDLFQSYVFFANCTTRHTLSLDVVAPASLASGDFVETKVDATNRIYVARTGVGNQTVRAESISNSGGDILITYTSHGLLNGDTIYISEITGGSLTSGTYYVVSSGANTFKISLSSGGAAVAYSAVTSLYFEGVTNGTYPIFALNNSSPSVSTQLRTTAQGLVKAINRDASSLVIANYVSGITDTPGRMRITADGFTGTISVRANSTGAGEAFAPVLPSSFASGNQVESASDRKPASIFMSKINEPEAVPLVNELIVGSRNKAILRILALRDSVIVLKEEGVFKVTGDNPLNFTVTALDNTIFTIAANSAARLNNQVYFLSNQGVCIATDSSVEIVSRRIENLVEPITGQSLISSETFSVAYDSDRTYRLSTLGPNDTTQTVTYLHNTINDTWTTADTLFQGGIVGPKDTLYLVADNKIIKERKNYTKIDYMGQNHTATVVSVATGNLSAVITSASYQPLPGDCLVKNNVISRFSSVSDLGANQYQVVFWTQCNLVAADSLQLYERIVSDITMAPYHAGSLGRTKQVSQLQVRTRNSNIRRIDLSFQTQSFGGSEITTWLDSAVTSSGNGWGDLPFGFFPFGQEDVINNVYVTQPALPIRILVPLFAQRSSWIKLVMSHKEAGESMEIQALCWTVRGYKERVSK